MSRSPYKYLDYYRFEDADLFFGREEETRRMVGEILSSRLLVLFSPSGSGKTSLINAGVRPQLEEMGYRTVYTRMEDEPVSALRQKVAQVLKIPVPGDEKELYDFLKESVGKVRKPLVIFLDQFEEFFIIFRDRPGLMQEFIRQAAQIKYDDDLPVYLVFSLREEYFAHLHEFRDTIPSIFKNNANIHLESFDDKEARRAIEEPLKKLGWCYEEGMVDTLVNDLNEKGKGIEPIKLQLVCSKLWKQREEESKQVSLSSYEAYGRVDKILDNFVFESLKSIPRHMHRLMVKVFESLKTPDNTKRYRSFQDLQSQLGIRKKARLEVLLQKLTNIGILRREERSGTYWYEFKHDYLVHKIFKWIEMHIEKRNRRRLFFAAFPGVVLFLTLFVYFFIQYNTFYAGFTRPKYDFQQKEIVIYRGFDPFGDQVTTGYFIEDVKEDSRNTLEEGYKISSWDKNDWSALAWKLSFPKNGGFLYSIGLIEPGTKILMNALKYKLKKDPHDWLLAEGLNVERELKIIAKYGKYGNRIPDALLAALKNEAYYIRLRAANGLGELGIANQRVVHALESAMNDDSLYVREAAAEALVKLEKADQNVLDLLITAMRDKESDVKKLAAEELGKLGKADQNVIDVIITAVKDKESDVRKSAAEALGKLGKADQNVLDVLITAMKDKESDVRKSAAEALGKLGKADQKVLDTLITAMKDNNSDVRKLAAESLSILGKTDQNVLDALLVALKDESDNVRAVTACALGNLGKADQRVIDNLKAAFKDKDKNVRLYAALGLYDIFKANQMKADFFYETMLDRQSDVRFIAAFILAGYYKADPKIVIDTIMEAITYKESVIRGLAAIYLGGLDKTDQKNIHTLMETLKDKESGVRLNAAEALGKIYQAKSEKELLELLKHPSSSYRIAGAYALARKKSISAQTMNRIKELKDNDKRPWVRLGAWEAFIQVQESQEKEKKKE